MFHYDDYRILLACGNTDMRKCKNGLCEIVLNHFELDPRDKVMFAFCNSQRNRVKILVWEDNAFWIHFMRLEMEVFHGPTLQKMKTTCIYQLKNLKMLLFRKRQLRCAY